MCAVVVDLPLPRAVVVVVDLPLPRVGLIEC